MYLFMFRKMIFLDYPNKRIMFSKIQMIIIIWYIFVMTEGERERELDKTFVKKKKKKQSNFIHVRVLLPNELCLV